MGRRPKFVLRSEVGRDKWDSFVDASDEAWLWHRYDFIDALGTWPTYQDASFGLMDDRGTLVAAMPLHCRAQRYMHLLPIVRLASLGGPALAPHLQSLTRWKMRSHLKEHLQNLITKNNAVALEVQLAPLAPWLHGPSPPKINPLIIEGMENRQTETWMIDLSDTPDNIRKRYSELTRRELRKAARQTLRVREASGPRDLERYYRLHLETYARTGATAHPIDYFQAIFEKFQAQGLARIVFAERGGEVVAAQNQLAQARSNYYTALAGCWNAKIDLEVATGQ